MPRNQREGGNGRGEANVRDLIKMDSGHCQALKLCIFPLEVLTVGFSEAGMQTSETQEEEDGGTQEKQTLRLPHLQGSQGEAWLCTCTYGLASAFGLSAGCGTTLNTVVRFR